MIQSPQSLKLRLHSAIFSCACNAIYKKEIPKFSKEAPKNCRRDCRCLQQNQFELILLRKTLQENVRNVTTIFSNVFVFELSNVLKHSNVFFSNEELHNFFCGFTTKTFRKLKITITLQPRKKTHQCSLSFTIV